MSEHHQLWNLHSRPFEAPWDTRFFFAGRQHGEALDRLLYLVEERSMNIGVLTGDIGCGKTLTRAVLQASAAPDVKMIAIENSGYSMEELVRLMLHKLEPEAASIPPGKMICIARIEQLIEAYAAAGRHVVILLDEAQDMPLETLRELRWITNFNGGGRSIVTLVLIGQPNLRSMIEASPAIDQRVSLRFHVQALDAEETAAYLAHRLHIAGHPNGQVFDLPAAVLLHRLTRGIPREINRLAKLSMEHAWASDSVIVNSDHVMAVARDLMRHQNLSIAA